MKAIFIAYNMALTERVDYLLDRMNIRGYTQWISISGRGSETGEPHMGTHTWPEMNNAILSIVPNEKVPEMLKYIKKMDEINKEVGIRAFVWDIVDSY
jgi:nitrogen regulatory protein PII